MGLSLNQNSNSHIENRHTNWDVSVHIYYLRIAKKKGTDLKQETYPESPSRQKSPHAPLSASSKRGLEPNEYWSLADPAKDASMWVIYMSASQTT